MAHEIEIKNNKASFFTTNEPAWHGLGTVVQGARTSKEAIELANLGFEVKKAPLYADVKEVKGSEIMNQPVRLYDGYATFRADTNDLFGYVGSRYEIVQNLEAFEFFDDIVGQDEAIYETAGVLFGGRRIFITAKMPDYIKVPDGYS